MTRSGKHFHFKQFSIRHDNTTMKVGTDGVLLGAWVNPGDAKYILDIGTGSGVIALMLAQRTAADVIIDAVEVERQDAEQAEENIALSPWPAKILVHQGPVQQYSPGRQYDLIVSNPPYFVNSLEPPNQRRIEARHTLLLSHEDLLLSTTRLLSQNGRFSVILPYNEGLHFIERAKFYNLCCTRQWSFRTRREKPIERWLLEFSFLYRSTEQGEILLYNEGNDWSQEYRDMTRNFYLKL
jgi:tRNA1Val (adenine37-N6)-methyltransferase